MAHRRLALTWATVVVLASIAAAQAPAAVGGAATRAAAAPAASGPAKFLPTVDDKWLAEAALAELKRYAATGEYEALAPKLEQAALARLAAGRTDDLAALSQLVFCYKACAYFALAEKLDGGKETVQWLLAHDRPAQTLFRALADVKDPGQSLKAYQELLAADEKNVAEFPELAAAFATTLPLKHYKAQPEPCKLLDAWRWYTSGQAAMKYDLKLMPYELSRYLADTRLSIAERQWAYTTYGRSPVPARCYFDVRYDSDHFRKGLPKKIESLPYTLMNLKQVGGVCIEQAYYASEVCKALGMPAVIVRGTSDTGIGHAWVACLKVAPGGREAAWDAKTGRYAADQYYTGRLIEPATGRQILDNELMLAGAASQLPAQRRAEADAAVVLARLVEKVRDKAPEPDMALLGDWAQRHNAASAEGKPKAVAPPAARKLDLAVVEELLTGALDRNLVHSSAWEMIIELRKAQRLPVEHLDRFFNVLVTRTARQYPDYSAALVMRIIPTVDGGPQTRPIAFGDPEPARREAVYKRAAELYAFRPDLQGKIMIALGDEYKQQTKPELALAAYEQAALRCIDLAEVVLEASARAEGLLIENKRRDLAIAMYRKLFSKAQKERVADDIRPMTAHYQLGKRLAQLLRDAGQNQEAQQVDRAIQ